MTDPETLARRRWKEAAAVLDNRDRVGRLFHEAATRATWLRKRLPQTEHEARAARARAIVEGKTLAESDETSRLRDELAALEDELPVLGLAVDMVGRELWTVRRDNQAKWHQEQDRIVERARRVVERGGRPARTGRHWRTRRPCSAGSPTPHRSFSAWRKQPQRAVAGNLRAAAASDRRTVARAITTDRIDRLARGWTG